MSRRLRAPRRSLLAAFLSAAAVALLCVEPALAAFPPGPLTVGQLPGRDGCLSRTGGGGACAIAPALDLGPLDSTGSLSTSPDGRHLYVAAGDAAAVVVLARDGSTGAVRQASCAAEPGGGAGCAPARATDQATGTAPSPDGRHVYVSSARGSVAAFARDPSTGALTQVGCVSQLAIDGCDRVRALLGAQHVAVSPDGRHVYVAAELSSAVVVLRRDPDTGRLSGASCVTSMTIDGCTRISGLQGAGALSLSPDGNELFLSSEDAVSLFRRDLATGGLRRLACASVDGTGGDCRRWSRLEGAGAPVPSPDGRFLYVPASISNAITTFRVDGGRLARVACLEEDPQRPCRRGSVGLDGALDVTISPSGRTLYLASKRFTHGLTVFRRNPGTGGLSTVGCLTRGRSGGACAKGIGVYGARSVTLSPDARNVYVAGALSDALAVLGPDVGVVGRRWPVSSRGTVRLRLACPANARAACRGTLRLQVVRPLRLAGRRQPVIGSARFSVPRGTRRTLRVVVSRRFRGAVRRTSGVRVRPLVRSGS